MGFEEFFQRDLFNQPKINHTSELQCNTSHESKHTISRKIFGSPSISFFGGKSQYSLMHSVTLVGPRLPHFWGMKCFACSLSTNFKKGWPRSKLRMALPTADLLPLQMAKFCNHVICVLWIWFNFCSYISKPVNSNLGWETSHLCSTAATAVCFKGRVAGADAI